MQGCYGLADIPQNRPNELSILCERRNARGYVLLPQLLAGGREVDVALPVPENVTVFAEVAQIARIFKNAIDVIWRDCYSIRHGGHRTRSRSETLDHQCVRASLFLF